MIEADFETRSDIDIGKQGAFVYFESPRARVLLGSFKRGEERLRWRYGEPCPPALAGWIETGETITAHNAGFEILCFQWLHANCGWPAVPLEQFRCTAATAAAMQLPRSLDRLAVALRLETKKDKDGKRLIRKFSIPQKDGQFIRPEDDPEDFDRFHDYCDVDVEVEAAADARMVPLSVHEQAVYTLSERINHRGIRIDVESARAALRIAERAKELLDAEMAEITGGAVKKCSEVAKLTAWLEAHGVPVESLKKADIDDLLEYDDLPQAARSALLVRQEAAKTSVAKIEAMLKRASKDGRVRGSFIYHGAGTGRWTNVGVNFANMPRNRKCFEGLRQDLLFDAIRTGDPGYLRFAYGDEIGRPLHLLSDAIRGLIWAAPGHDLIQADYSNIEGVVVAWTAGEEWKLAAFREVFADPDNVPDLYRRTAAGILNLPLEVVTKKHWGRQAVGKPAELACFSAETQVLTSNGVKAIVEVTEKDLLWDGVEWITHQGVISKGARQTVNVDGIDLTADHLVLTPRGWASAQELASDPNTLARALARGSANLPSSGLTRASAGAFGRSLFNAVVARTRILSRSQTYAKAPRPAARNARGSLRASPVASCITATKTLYRMIATAQGCSTVSPLATAAVSTPGTAATPTMAGGASPSSGAEIVVRSWPIWSRLKAGTTPIWNWTALTWTAITGRGTSVSSLGRRTLATNAQPAKCRPVSESLKPKSRDCVPVFDILNAGPRNRFTVCSNSGYLIAHNCGYQGGVPAFYTFARAAGVKLPEIAGAVLETATPEAVEKAERRFIACHKRNTSRARELGRDAWVACEIIKNGWRAQNAAIAQSWKDLEAAVRAAVENPGEVTEAARVKYVLRFGFLWALLPSGRCLAYGSPRLKAQVWAEVLLEDGSWSDAEVMDKDAAERGAALGRVRIQGDTSDKVTVMGVDSNKDRWVRYGLYGGIICENNTQAIARDILVNGMFKAEAAGYPIIAHVYDEMIAEIPRGFGSLAEFERVICDLPPWAEGMPIAAGGWRGKRYRKD